MPLPVVKSCWFQPGAENGDGGEAHPFGTLVEVRSFVRSAVQNAQLPEGVVEVVVKNGRYNLTQTAQFCAEDSGSAKNPVRWRAETRGGVRISGGKSLPKLEPVSGRERNRLPREVRDRVLMADLGKAGFTQRSLGVVRSSGSPDPWAGAELVWNGRIQTLARWPNDGYTGIASTPPTGPDKDGKWQRAYECTYDSDHVSNWRDEADPHGNGFFCFNWAACRLAFEKIEPSLRKLVQKYKGGYGFSKGGYWYGCNLFCEIDCPGEYYIDRKGLKLYFLPPDGAADPLAEVTQVTDLVHAKDVRHLTFDGFALENCRGTGIDVRGGTDLAIIACTMRAMGLKAVNFVDVSESRIAGCDIGYCGEGGISLAGGDPQKLVHANVTVENCHIHHFSESQLAYRHAVQWAGCGFCVTRCTIHDGPHAAILFRGRENEISFNEIHSVCLECGEIGAIYAGRDWTLCGNVITGNWIHDIYNPRDQRNRGIMLDDGAAGFTMASNRFERVAEGISLSAIGNRIEHNVFVSNFPPVSCWQNWEGAGNLVNRKFSHPDLTNHLAKVPVREEPWASRYPYLRQIDDAIRNVTERDPATRTVIADNWTTGGSVFTNFPHRPWRYSPVTWDIRDNAEEGSPAPAWTKDLPPLLSIGCQASPERASWPVVHPVTVKCANLVYDKATARRQRYPKVEKKGTIEYGLIESNPIVFKGKPWLCEHFHWRGCRFLSLEDYRTYTPVVAKGGGMACAFVDGDKLYVTACHGKEKRFVIYESDDMIHWSEPRTVFQNPDWGPYFNTSLCKADGRYVMAIELYGKVGPKYIMSFLESKDLKDWKLLEDAGYTKRWERYCGSPCLKYHDGWFYFFYLENEGHPGDKRPRFRTRVVRSRNLRDWTRGNRVVLDFGDEDRKAHPKAQLTPEQRASMKTDDDRNASDFDLCEYNGNVIISYNWGNQGKVQYLGLGEVKNITEKEFCESFFTPEIVIK